MDDFKRKAVRNYTSWDINCPYICRMRKTRNKLIKIFKRTARRKLKEELKRNGE